VGGEGFSRKWVPRWLGAARDAIVSVFLPAPCRICDQLLATASTLPICEECLAAFRALPPDRCAICGIRLVKREDGAVRCPSCPEARYQFDCARSYAVYEDALVRAVVLLKFEKMTPLGRWLARRLAELVQTHGYGTAADVVVPVPLHKDRLHQRGYNQAELISRPLARLLGVPHRPVLLVRTRPRPDKLHLTFEERWESVRGAFAAREGSQVDNLRVLLVDDVLTTGATLDACARALRAAGAKSVTGLTAARALQDGLQKAAEPDSERSRGIAGEHH